MKTIKKPRQLQVITPTLTNITQNCQPKHEIKFKLFNQFYENFKTINGDFSVNFKPVEKIRWK